MAEIGATLREARMRARVDISEVEAATKIRAKYLRALENEEWDLLPGPTFVAAFLRTYAEYLGLDARMLVEEYRLRQGRPDEVELPPIGAGGRPPQRERSLGSLLSPRVVLVLVILVLVVALYALGSSGGGGGTSPTTSPRAAGPGTAHRPARPRRAAPPRGASVRIAATATVYACLIDAGGRRVLNGQTLSAGQTTPTFRAASFRLTLGNPQARLTVNGGDVPVPQSSNAINFAIDAQGARVVPAGSGANCG